MLLTLSAYGHIPIVFVLATAVYFGVFGEIYSLFPATSGDTFGAKFATTNNGMLYTAKGTASLLVPLASLVSAKYGWQAVFVIAVALNATAALMALFVIKPMRRAFILGHETAESEAGRGRQGRLIRPTHRSGRGAVRRASFLLGITIGLGMLVYKMQRRLREGLLSDHLAARLQTAEMSVLLPLYILPTAHTSN